MSVPDDNGVQVGADLYLQATLQPGQKQTPMPDEHPRVPIWGVTIMLFCWYVQHRQHA